MRFRSDAPSMFACAETRLSWGSNLSLYGSSVQHLVHHGPGRIRPGLAVHRGGRGHVHPGFRRLHRALRENTALLKFFSVFLGLIFFLELTAGILAFAFKDWIKDQLNFFINNNVKAYRDDIDLQNLIDFAQDYWSCCGAHGPNDWNLNIYFNCTELNPSRERCGVPFSCCVKDPAEDVLNTQCGYDVRLQVELDQQKYIYTKGCVGQFEKWLQDNLIVVAGIFVGIALLQIFGICLAQNLVSDIKAVKANW
ncbi:hypothetical protein ANANG_G00068340 [Anguilla anguilla]|uniref:Tetraspanin n=1 Tax=Anguilla anguilla TaxID=7936 RepID=A0A9D3S5T3_ANGAN|nr:hypothetical protein ANANG_G00068340 [Anguilla anguilla]